MGLDDVADVTSACSRRDGATVPVTVIVPAYNAASTLPRALASVLAQTWAPAEIVVVDDASEDQTSDVLQGFCVAHPGWAIKTERLQRNVGAASARNAGWELATQEYVAFLDADDAWHPRKLEIQCRWMVAHPQVALSGHRCEVIDEAAEIPDLQASGASEMRFGLGSFLVANRLSTPSVMLRRSVGQRFAAGKRYSEDYLLWMEIAAAHGPAGYIDLPLAFLYKAKYGASGLSGKLWQMQRGELDTLSRLRRMSLIGRTVWLLASAWSWTKFLRRVALSPFRESRR